MGKALLVLALIAAACGRPDTGSVGQVSPSPAASPVASPTVPVPQRTDPPTAAPATRPPVPPTPTMAATVGAKIDFHAFPLSPATYENAALGEGSGGVIATGPTGSWTSGWYEPGFGFTRLVPSWNADVMSPSWITVEVQGRKASGGETRWWGLGTWVYDDAGPTRASVNGQRDADGRIETDTLIANAPLAAYRMKVTFAGAQPRSPVLRYIAAVVSDDAAVRSAPESAHGGVVADIAVPQYSQEIHTGEYPQYDGGGEAWCSPTSTAMILAHWKKGPTAAEMSWVDGRYADPQVDHAARYTYDATYRGTGNWTFNTAYAAKYGVRAFVTQLRSLAEAERFIAAGIPLVASVTIPPGGLSGFLLPEGSNGHLLVIRGFTANGDIISNDPAARSNDAVRRVYQRGQFERVWIGGSGGIVYVIHPPDVPLPARVTGTTPNW